MGKRWSGIGLAVLLVCGSGLAEIPTMESVKKDIKGMQGHLTNAKVKIRHGMTGVSRSAAEETARRPPTPAEACCSGNLRKIDERIRHMNQSLEQWDLIYSKAGNNDALQRLNVIRSQLGEVSAGVAQFKMAGTPDRAMQALQGIIRPFNEMREATLSLEACCPLSGADPAEPKKEAPAEP